MTRDIARELTVQLVFGFPVSGTDAEDYLDSFLSEEHFNSLQAEDPIYEELPKGKMMTYIQKTFFGVLDHLDEIDQTISRFSKGWSLNRLSGTARAVLRVAVYELVFASEEIPVGAAINSAVEIDKKYDGPEINAFVNGVLGSVSRDVKNN